VLPAEVTFQAVVAFVGFAEAIYLDPVVAVDEDIVADV
jgi:hypothetical protein